MDSNDINRSSVAGRDIVHSSCPIQHLQSQTNIDFEDLMEKLQKRLSEGKPASDHISREAMTYFVNKTQELEKLVDIYMEAVVTCFQHLPTDMRTKISFDIVEAKRIMKKESSGGGQ